MQNTTQCNINLSANESSWVFAGLMIFFGRLLDNIPRVYVVKQVKQFVQPTQLHWTQQAPDC